MSETWWQALLGGSVGSVASVVIAIWVVRRQARSDQEARRNDACLALLTACNDIFRMTQDLYDPIDHENDALDQASAGKLLAELAYRTQASVPFAFAAGGDLVPAFMNLRDRIQHALDMVWDSSANDHFNQITGIQERLEDVLTVIRRHLVRASGLPPESPELEQYL